MSLTTAGIRGGAWNVCTYVRLYGINADFGALVFLSSVLQPASSLEVGCGAGAYTSWMAKSGVAPAWGLEPEAMPSAIFSASGWPRQLVADFSEPRAVGACSAALGSFDLVFSFEVAEHIPRERHDAIVDFLVSRTARFLVFSASPHRNGHGHISPRSRQDWRLEFERRGMVYLPEVSDQLRRESHEINHKKNSLVFASRRAFERNDTKVLNAIRSSTDMSIGQSRRRRGKTLNKAACGALGRGTVAVGGNVLRWAPRYGTAIPLKAGEIAVWPELILQQAACFGDPITNDSSFAYSREHCRVALSGDEMQAALPDSNKVTP